MTSFLRHNRVTMAARSRTPTKPVQKIAKIKNKVDNAEDLAYLPEEKLAVADKIGRQVRIFDRNGKYLSTLAKDVKPYGVSTNRSGLITFTDCHNGKRQIQVRTQTGDVVAKWGNDIVWKPRSVCMTNKGQILVTDLHDNATKAAGLYTIDGRSILKFGMINGGRDDRHKPWHMTMDPFDRCILGDKDTAVIKVHDSTSGKQIVKFGGKDAPISERMRGPRGIKTDAQGNILICDSGHNRVAVFSPDGRFINHILQGQDGINLPHSIAFSHIGRLAVGCHQGPGGQLRKIRIYQVIQSEGQMSIANGDPPSTHSA